MRCPICNKDYGEITPKHAQTHGMTMQEMRAKYPELQHKNFKFGRNTQEQGKPRPVRHSDRRMI